MEDKKIESLAYRLADLNSLRSLFAHLNYDFADKPVNKDTWTDDERNVIQEARLIAKKDDYKVYYLQTNTDSQKYWKGISAKIIKENHGMCLICSHNPSGFKWVFSSLSKDFSKSFNETRHIPIDIRPETGAPKTFVDFLENIRVSTEDNTTTILAKMSNAFDSFAIQIHDELTVNVFEALKTLSEGIIYDQRNNLSLSDETLEEIREPLFILLYRIIFILYAEDRGIFPIDDKIYRDEFSLKWIKEEWLLKYADPKKLAEYQVQKRLKHLFKLIEVGSEELDYKKEEFFMPSYYGRIFDRKINNKLEEWNISNSNLLEAISLITRSRDKKGNYFFLDYAALETRHLGSIYEGLLEYHLTVKNNKIVELPNALDRKSSASYYTPEYIVEYIVQNTIEPLIKKIHDETGDKLEQVEKILSLNILDPAMGSGHFLIGAVNYIASRICEIENGEVLEHNFIERKRDVARRCVYGVDINPLAVDLAMVSIWIETLSSDKPLSFLSAHLKNGNSLIGTEIDVLFNKQTTLMESQKGREQFKGNIKDFIMFENLEDDSSSAVKTKIEKYQKIQSKGTIYYNIKSLLDCKVAESFGLDIPVISDFKAKIGENSLDFFSDGKWGKIQNLSSETKFFHWDLEFSDIFYDENGDKRSDGGFDCIIGNPPYLNLQDLKDKTLKSIYDKRFSKIYSGQGDLLYLFFGLISFILKKHGILGFITSRYYLESKYAKKLRAYLNDYSILNQIVDFGSNVRIFKEANTNTCITILRRKEKPENINQVSIAKIKTWSGTNKQLLDFIQQNLTKKINTSEISIYKSYQNDFSEFRWNLDSSEIKKIKEKLYENSEFLGSHNNKKGVCKIFQGISSGLDFIKQQDNKKNPVFRVTGTMVKEKKLENGLIKPLIKIGMIRRYKINYTNEFTILTLDDTEIKNYPNIKNHLQPFKKELAERHDIKKSKAKWWRYANLRNISLLTSKQDKLFVPMTSPENRFVFINSDEFVCGGDVYVLMLNENKYNLRYIQGILNSTLMNLFVKLNSKAVDGAASTDLGIKQNRFSYNSNNLQNLPIKGTSLEKQNQIIKLVQEIEKLYIQKDSSDDSAQISKQIKFVDNQIDEIVNEIYNITSNDLLILQI